MRPTRLLCAGLAVNILTLFAYGIDKYKAKHGKWQNIGSHAALAGCAGRLCRRMAGYESVAPQDRAEHMRVVARQPAVAAPKV